jgi:(p)ppGpp synthase/HD superfamily hydrolase
MVYERDFQYLAGRLAERLTEEESALVRRAYEVAETAHRGQMRDEGTPYIVHPVRVAASLVDELAIYSPELICGALMHDVIEDSPVTRDEIAEAFGEEIAEVVWLLTKLEEVTLPNYLAAIEASGTGATIVKLCDRLDNLRFLSHSPKVEKIHRYIRTTEIFYLPMAARANRYLHDQLRHWLDQARNHIRSAY